MKIDTDLRNHPDVLWYPRWDSWANVKADWSTYANTYGDAPNTWPKLLFTKSPAEWGGIPVGRFESVSTATLSQAYQGVGQNIMLMRKYFNENTREMLSGTTLGKVPLNDLYMRYCIMFESDIWQGINESGMKLPGLETKDWGHGDMVTVMWHSSPAPAYNPPYSTSNPMYLSTYFHGKPDFQPFDPWYGNDWIKPPYHDRIYIQPDMWYCIEQHLIMNSMQPNGTGNYDGLFDMWINDELVLSMRNIKIRDYNPSANDPVEIQQFYGLIYHGGIGKTPIAPIHYRITGVALAKRRIGMPPFVP